MFWNKLLKFKEVVANIGKKSVEVQAKSTEAKKTPRAFSVTSTKRLQNVHPEIVRVLELALQEIDFMVICGWRGEAEQNEAFAKKTSRVKYPNGYHNCLGGHIKPENLPQNVGPDTPCSLAIDLAPLPLDWNNLVRFEELAKVIKKHADQQGVLLDWGFDLWRFDHPHYQLTSYRKK